MTLLKDRPAVFLAAVALPPPLHGQSFINRALVDQLRCADKVRTVVVDIGPRTFRSRLGYHTNRVLGLCLAIAQEFRQAVYSNRTLYTVIESGGGRIYNALILFVARLLRFKIVAHHHTSYHTLNRDRWFALIALIAGGRALHVVLSEDMARDLRRRYSLVRRVIILHNAQLLPTPKNVVTVGSAVPKLTIGFLSNLSREKGVDRLFDVMRIGQNQGLEIYMKLAGPVTDVSTAEMMFNAKTEFGAALDAIGPLEPSEKAKFFSSIDCFVFLSRYWLEAQPLVVLEAMSYGVPTIVSRCGYAPEIVSDAGHVASTEQDVVSIIRKYINGELSLQLEGARVRARFLKLKSEGEHAWSVVRKQILDLHVED